MSKTGILKCKLSLINLTKEGVISLCINPLDGWDKIGVTLSEIVI